MGNLTIKDIADIAGVAKSTVSRYLNGGKISEETSDKIRKVIEENNYEPNAFAQSLKAKRTKFIGIIAPCLDSIVTSKVIMAVDENLRINGYNSLILNTSLNKNLEIEYLQNLSRLKVDGIVLVATEISEKHKNAISKLKIPILVIGQEYEKVNSIINDDYNAGQTIAEYVKNFGHKRILYLGVPKEDIAVGIKRRDGIIDKLNESTEIEIREEITDFTAEESEKIATEVLKEYKPTAIICATDKIALGAIRSINKIGKTIKDDISITGFGGYDIATLVSPNLTTIKFKNEVVGKTAAESIIKMIECKEIPKLQIVGFDFIKGNSVKNLK